MGLTKKVTKKKLEKGEKMGKRWTIEETVAMVIGYKRMKCSELVNWLNDLFENDRTKGAIENRMSLIRGNYSNLPEQEQEGHKETITRIEACGIEIPPAVIPNQFTGEDRDDTIFALMEGNQLLKEQNNILERRIKNLETVLGKIGIETE